MLLHGAFVPEDWALLYPFFLFATAFWHILITLSPTSMVPDVTLTDVTISPPVAHHRQSGSRSQFCYLGPYKQKDSHLTCNTKTEVIGKYLYTLHAYVSQILSPGQQGRPSELEKCLKMIQKY